MARWIGLEAAARDRCRRLELLPAAEPDAMALLRDWYAARQLLTEALR